MKNILLATAIIFASGAAAFAQYSGPSDLKQGQDGTYAATTVKEILDDPKDDVGVQLEGKLIRQSEKEAYTFSDGTGEIRVEIDQDDFPGGDIDENTVLRIQGEVDTHLRKEADIDVDHVTIMK
ncbi:YgiW/YdeI family stress tolerance OB fold protein [Paracoccus sp. NGMCC 1.201697]|uniref:YgiW/YdeI family stress tolerance OB fold protein n=1 Tax=Paracoccus broussonetiae subsp. drimophilus TaxID=3373869 RepID=A0ABW7LNE5_9RHOB